MAIEAVVRQKRSDVAFEIGRGGEHGQGAEHDEAQAQCCHEIRLLGACHIFPCPSKSHHAPRAASKRDLPDWRCSPIARAARSPSPAITASAMRTCSA